MYSYLAAAEETEKLRDIGIDPYAVGGIALAILVILMLALLAFGKGREHS
jgi:preprotein translocase subunit Sec61beta